MVVVMIVRLWSRNAFEKFGLLAYGVESEIGKTERLWRNVGAAWKNTCVGGAKEKASLCHVGNCSWMLDESCFYIQVESAGSD
jgi:hypothetical protein